MKPELWNRIKRILPEVRELPPEARATHLDEACEADPELRHEIETLLAADQGTLAFMDRPPIKLLGEDETGVGEDSQVGTYRILGQLGQGGMGVVYLATKVGDESERQMALKVLQLSQTSEEGEQRFLQEMRILAKLDHPNIAKIQEGGRTEDGRLYYLMEHVEGQAIDDYCRERKLSLEERLRLFQRVAAAVQYAHTKLVIHRDIKPSNVLVTAAGEPKLLDFGVAKPLEGAGIETTVLTGGSQKPFTPDYASPEQISGEDIHIASDVYSLGVLLYQLLAGARPYRLEALTEQEIGRTVCDETPPPPSAAFDRATDAEGTSRPPITDPTTASFRRRLQGDLDTIVLMALRKEPGRRYGSVDQLSDDLQRYLDQEPVLARQSSTTYRLGKFFRRNGRSLAAIATAVLLLLTFTVSTTVQQRRTARERDKYQFVSEFLLHLFEVANPRKGPGEEVTARELLDGGTALLQDRTHGQPLLRAELQVQIATAYHALGHFQPARELLARALASRERELGRHSLEVAEVLDGLAVISTEQGDLDEAERLFQEAQTTIRQIAGDRHPLLGDLLHNYSTLLMVKRDLPGARDLLEEALDIRQAAWGATSAPAAESLSQLGTLLKALESFDEAEATLRNALEIRLRLFGENHPDTATTLHNLGWLLDGLGRDAEAEDLYRRAIAVRRRRLGANHPALADSLYNLSTLLGRTGRYAEAELASEEATTIWSSALGSDHPRVAYGLTSRATALRRLGRLEEGEVLFRRALDLRLRAFGPDHHLTSVSRNNLAVALQDQKQYEEAMGLYAQVLASRQEQLGHRHTSTANTITNIGTLQEDTGLYEEALGSYSEALEIRREILGPDHPETISSKANLASALLALGRLQEATDLAEATLEELTANPSARPKAIAQTKSVLGACRALSGDLTEAGELLQSAVTELAEADGPRARNTQQARARLRSLLAIH